MTGRYCKRCGVHHQPIQQAVPDKPVGYYRDLILDLVVIVMVIGSVLLWVGVMS